MGAMRSQIHQNLSHALVVVLIDITFRRDESSGRRMVGRTHDRATRIHRFRTLTSCGVGVDPERRLTTGRRSVNIDAIFILPLYTGRQSSGGVLPFAFAF